MKISLRKAHAIQASIREAIDETDLCFTINVNRFQEWRNEVQKAKNSFFKNLEEYNVLHSVLHSVRAKVGKAKELAGISEKLAEGARLDKQIATYTVISQSDPMLDHRVLDGNMDIIKHATVETQSSYGFVSTVKTNVLSREEIAELKRKLSELKREKQALNDKVLELNVKTEIELTEEEASVLRSKGIL